MAGTVSLYLSFVFGVLALFSYGMSIKGKERYLRLGRKALYGHFICTLIASGYLIYALLTHKFQYSYVFYYSEKALEFKYLLSAFWAGQEGTYLLWAFFGAFISLFLIRRKIKDWEAPVLMVMVVVQLILLFFLLMENPFSVLSPAPDDGYGLNPLLKNPWMVIHPPVVFLGYALLLVPYAFAMAALWKKNYQDWVSLVLPWAISGWLTLGAGIIIGAYWAYRVLGWGGYWSWDPVENASLIPWLLASALIHGLLLQIYRLKMPRSNIILAILTYVLVIHATFLTRSGLVADFSVHSFSATPLNFYLGLFLFVTLSIGVITFLIRLPAFKALPLQYQESEQIVTRGGMLKLSAIGFVAISVLVLVGTLAPLFTGFISGVGSVGSSFYVQTILPLALLMTLFLGFSVLLPWQPSVRVGKEVSKLKFPLIFAVLGTIVAYYLEVREWLPLTVIAVALFALGANLIALISTWHKRGFLHTGAYWAHLGVAIVFIGILGSTGLSQSEIAVLPQGQTQEALGYTITYLGRQESEGRVLVPLEIEKGTTTYQVVPEMYVVGRESRQMREPGIIRYWWGDLYISPLDTQAGQRESIVYLERNETVRFGDVAITFTSFQAPQHSEQGVMEVGANLVMAYQGEEFNATAMMVNTVRGWDREPIDIPGGGFLYLEGVVADEGIAILHLVPYISHGAANSAVIEISSRPLILILFWGTLLLMGGTAVAAWRRFIVEKG